jgi:hypothetical protein
MRIDLPGVQQQRARVGEQTSQNEQMVNVSLLAADASTPYGTA